MKKWNVVKYLIAGERLYAVEDYNGYIKEYCNTLTRATELAAHLNAYEM